MNKKNLLLLALAFAVSLSSCSVKTYPRPVTAKEKADSNVAWRIDTVGAGMMSRLYTGPRYDLDRQKVHIDYQYYLDPRFQDHPKLFYPRPEKPPEVQVVEKLAETDQHEILFLKWASQYQPQNPAFVPYYQKYPEDHTAYGIYFRSKKGNRAAMVISHGWTGGDVRKAYKMDSPLQFLPQGYDAVFLQQPYHGLRAPADSKFSGEYFFSGEVARINEAMCQTVTDVRSMVMWLHEKYPVVGLRGGSLGGITTLMTAVVEDQINFAIAWVPPSSLGDLPADTPLAPFIMKGFQASGLDLETVKKILYLSSPYNFQPVIPKSDVLIFAGMGDNFVPPALPAKIWSAWGEPQIFWFAGGHVLNFERKQCHAIESEFLARHVKN